MKRALSISLLACACIALAASPRFSSERTVTPGGKGANRLAVDVPLLSGAAPLRYAGGRFEGGLDDLRVFDAEGKPVPHLVIPPPSGEREWKAGRVLPNPATKKESGFELDLGTVSRVDRVRLSGLPPPFLKRFRLEGSGDRSRYTVLVAEGTVFDLPEEKLRRVETAFPPGSFRYLRVTWDDRSSARLPLPTSAEASPGAPGAPPPFLASLVFQRSASEPGKSRYRVRLPAARFPVAALVVTVDGSDVLRTASVTEPRLSGSEVAPASLGSATLRRAVRGSLVASDLRIPITAPAGPDLDLVVEDGSNPPLPVATILAELLPLPWIYFETATGKPLTVRYGDATASPPRYDLEAARPYVGKAALREARWGESRAASVAAPAPEGSPIPETGAPVEAKDFRFARKIAVPHAGLVVLPIDSAVLAHSRELADVRVAGAGGRQIPYLLEKRDEPLELPLAQPLALSIPNDKRTHYRIDLPFGTLPKARFVVSTSARIFERSVTLAAERPREDLRAAPELDTLATATWKNPDPELPAPPLILEIAPAGADALRLILDEGDNSRLPLVAPKLLLPSFRLRFFAPKASSLVLLYGNPRLSAPRYDLALLAPRLVGVAAEEVRLPPEPTEPARMKTPAATRLFWGVLIAAVVVLLALLGRLVGKGEAT